MGDDEGEAKIAGGAANVAWKMAGLGSALHTQKTHPADPTDDGEKRTQAAQ